MVKEIIFLFVFTAVGLPNIGASDPLPPVRILAYSPSGMRITMPDDDFKSVYLIGNLTSGLQTRTYRFNMNKAKAGYWIYIDKYLSLKLKDHFHFNVYADRIVQMLTKSFYWQVNAFMNEETLPNCEISEETVTICSKMICRGALIFNEEFDNANKFFWHKETMFPQGPDYPFNSYSSETIKIESGRLTISPKTVFSSDVFSEHKDYDTECTGEAGTRECTQSASGAQIIPPVVSGKVTTRKLFSFKYGRVDVRAKLPVGDWLISEISLEPLHNEYGKDRYGSGLIRIVCAKGNEEFSTELYGGPIVSDTEPYRSIFLKRFNTSTDWNEEFHIYTLIWEPSGFKLRVDGELYGDIKPIKSNDVEYSAHDLPHAKAWAQGTSMAPFDQLFYISIGVRVGGINDFPDRPGKPWKNSSNKALYKFWQSRHLWKKTWNRPSLLVDYIRVSAL